MKTTTICKLESCEGLVVSLGYCKKHYIRHWKGTDITAKSCREKTNLDRFEEKVVRTKKCWKWIGIKNFHGYGSIWNGERMALAHRLSYVLFVGEIPDGMCVLHKCDNPECTKPDHLWIGTKKDNSEDMVAKGRSVVGSRQGRSKLTESDVLKIRRLHKVFTQTAIAKMFGVGSPMISLIINRKNWTHI